MGVIVNLSAEEESDAGKVFSYLAEKPAADEKALAIEGHAVSPKRQGIGIKDKG
jgi:hypothetical protein